MAPPGKAIVAIATDGSSREAYATARKASESTGHKTLFTLKADERAKTPEALVRDQLAAELCAETEVECEHGVVDIVGPSEIIEVKHFRQYKHAVGQILAYGLSFEDKHKRIHLFSTVKDANESNDITETIEKARRLCGSLSIRLSYVNRVLDNTSNEDNASRKRQRTDAFPKLQENPPSNVGHNTIEKYVVTIQSGGVMNAPVYGK
jgi:hypothetical protein